MLFMSAIILQGCSQNKPASSYTIDQISKLDEPQLKNLPAKVWNQFSTDELLNKFQVSILYYMPLEQWNRLNISQLMKMSGWHWRYAPRELSDRLTKSQWLKMDESQLWYGASEELWQKFTKKELLYLKTHQFKDWPLAKFEERFQITLITDSKK